jgi:hypothetical protein
MARCATSHHKPTSTSAPAPVRWGMLALSACAVCRTAAPYSCGRNGTGGGRLCCGAMAAAAAAATAAAGADEDPERPRLGVQHLGVAPDAGVLAPLHGVLQPGGLSAPPAAAAMALESAAERLNSMLLLLGMAMARPCSRRVTTVMLSVDSRRCARSTRARAAVSASRLLERARRAAATACRQQTKGHAASTRVDDTRAGVTDTRQSNYKHMLLHAASSMLMHCCCCTNAACCRWELYCQPVLPTLDCNRQA